MRRARKKSSAASIPEYDLHGLTAIEAEREILRVLKLHEGKSGQQVLFIHGKGGSGVIAEVVARVGRRDPRVSQVEPGFLNPGITTLVLNGKRGGSPPPPKEDYMGLPPPRVRKRKR